MKTIFSFLVLVLLFLCPDAARAWEADLQNGTYKNPVLFADYSDPDVIRVDNAYYMVSSSFHLMPGIPVLKSTDLVNWQIIGHVYQRLDYSPLFDMGIHSRYGSVGDYGGGCWAPSIRYHNNEFYVYFPDPVEGIFVCKASNPAGPWSAPFRVVSGEGLTDPCPYWDTDGKAYLVHGVTGAGPLILRDMAFDGLSVYGTPRTIALDPLNLPFLEGPKFHKRGSYYYIFAPIGGVTLGDQAVFRSTNINGPYEYKIVLKSGSSNVNGPHQGGYVETPSGEGWFLHFQDRKAYGRIVHLQPVTWDSDGWPVMGEPDPSNNWTSQPVASDAVSKPFGVNAGTPIVTMNVGKPVSVRQKPNIPIGPNNPGTILTIPTSDEFNSSTLGLQWQWNHNPENSKWSLTERPGFLRLKAMPVMVPEQRGDTPPPPPSLRTARNTLTQMLADPAVVATTLLHTDGMADGQRAGLCVLLNNWLGVVKENGQRRIVINTSEDQIQIPSDAPNLNQNLIYLRITIVPDQTVGQCSGSYSYSLDGTNFIPFGSTYPLGGAYWKGARLGLFSFNMNQTGSNLGVADFEWFNYNSGSGQPDYSLAASPSSLSVARGSSQASSISISPQGGFNAGVFYSASALPSGVTANFSPNPTTGTSVLTLSASAAAATGNTNVIVTGTSGSLSHSTSINLTVTGSGQAAPMITSSGTASVASGAGFNYQIEATNSPTGYNATGLPPGLSVNTTSGVISGTTTAAGSYNVALTANNATGQGNKTLVLTVTASPLPAITSASASSATVGTAYSYQITATNNATSFTATGLPSGLSINTGNGLISGAATSAGNYTVTLTAGNSSGTGSSFTLALTVSPSDVPAGYTYIADENGSHAFSQTVDVAYGANGSYLYRYAVTGLISFTNTEFGGDPIVGVFKKGYYRNASVSSIPSITSAVAASATVGLPFSYQITANNNPASYSASGLPSGLSVNTTSGLISGTPSASGTSIITVRATNSFGTGEMILNLSVSSLAIWNGADIGSPSLAGSSSLNQATGVWTVAGSGADIWETSDQFRFVSQAVSGDATLIAEVTGMTTTDPWNKTGIMIRDSSAADSMHVSLFATQNNGINLQWRNSTGGQSSLSQVGGIAAPSSTNHIWLRLVRSGNTYTGHYSVNGGTTWILVGTATASFTGSDFAGLAVTSHNNSMLNTATFANLSLSGSSGVAAPVITSGGTANGTVGSSFSYQISASNNPTVYNASGLPAGLSINTTTGLISGTPSTPGTSTVSISAGNSTGTGQANLVLTVNSSSSWSGSDIGSPALAGASSFNSATGVWTVAGSGADIWETSDQFRFVSQSVSGNVTLIAEVTSMTTTDPWNKTGIMIRDSSAADSMHVSLFATQNNGINLQWRNSTGAQSSLSQVGGIAAPSSSNHIWLRLIRSGNTYTGHYSIDGGTTWVLVGTATASFTAGGDLAGMAVTSHNNNMLNTATFQNVTAN